MLLYQTHLALSSEALGTRHATVAATPFDLGLHGGEKYRPPLEIAEATEEASYECRIHGEVWGWVDWMGAGWGWVGMG